jgi:O-antigen ligase
LFVIVLLLASMHVVMAVTNSAATETDNSVVSTAIHLPDIITEVGLYVWCAALIMMRWRRTLAAIRASWPILLLPMLAVLSMTWSIDPILTLRRSIIFSLSTIMYIYVGERWGIDEFAELFAKSQCILILGSFAMYFIAPQIALDPSHMGSWRGLTGHKNTFGESMGVTAVLLFLVRFRRFRWLQVIFFLASGIFLYLAHSATAIVVCALTFCLMPFFRVARLRLKERTVAYSICGVLLAIIAYVILNHSTDLLLMLGRDATLTGRTELWSLVVDAIKKQPLLGYGYEAFWEGFRGQSREILQETGWLVPMAHNGYLDLCLGLGLVGFAAFLFVFFRSVKLALEYIRRERRMVAFWPISYLCFFSLHNMTESSLLTRTTFEFLIFAVIATSLQQQHARAPLEPARNRRRLRIVQGRPGISAPGLSSQPEPS